MQRAHYRYENGTYRGVAIHYEWDACAAGAPYK